LFHRFFEYKEFRTDLSTKHYISFGDIEVEKELGKGSYGKVWLGRWNGSPVALKFCRESEGLKDFLKEVYVMMYVILDWKIICHLYSSW
jgi:predicted Ser/Thr protein kinase